MSKGSFRKRKSQLNRWIREYGVPELKTRLADAPAAAWVHPVLSMLYHREEAVFPKAVELCGWVVLRLWNEDREAARNVIRRLFWSLNEESGSIGWGSPEALGAIIESSESIAREYARLLISLLRSQASFIDHPSILNGILWAAVRIVRSFPQFMDTDVSDVLEPYCNHPDPAIHEPARIARTLIEGKSSTRSM
ncbi:MAG: DVU0298 family protein [Thermodesulfobacteriota bacterium]